MRAVGLPARCRPSCHVVNATRAQASSGCHVWARARQAGQTKPRYHVSPVAVRFQPERPTTQGEAGQGLAQDEQAQVQQRTEEQQEQDAPQLQLVLPISWELQIDEVVAKYVHMDERLDAMERQLLEMTREMRTSTASLTGGVKSISQGGTAGLPAPSGLSSAVVTQGQEEAGQGHTTTGSSGQNQHQQQGGSSAQPASPVAIVGSDGAPVHPSGTTTRGATHSSGLLPPSGVNEREQIMQEAREAAAIAKAAQEEESDSDEEGRQGPLQQALHSAKQALGNMPQAVLDNIPTPSSMHQSHKPHPPAHQHHDPHHKPPPTKAQGATEAPSAAAAPGEPAAQQAREGEAMQSADQVEAAMKEEEIEAARQRLLAQAAAQASAAAAEPKSDAKTEVAAAESAAGQHHHTKEKQGTQGVGGGKQQGNARIAEQWAEQQKQQQQQQLLNRESLYGFNRLQSAITELANSGYIESVKQLRETLLIQEWDMTNRHLAMRRGVAMFERYVAERDLVHEIGGYAVISALYEDPDAIGELLPNDRMKMLARSMIEECLNERRMQLYISCNQTAKEMASLTSTGVSSRMMVPIKQGLAGAALRIWGMVRSTFLPWTRFLPFIP